MLKRPLFIIFILALSIRITFAILSYNNRVYESFADDIGYYHFALDILNQGPFVLDVNNLRDNRTNYLGPGLPLVLAIIMMIFGGSWLPIFLVNAFIS